MKLSQLGWWRTQTPGDQQINCLWIFETPSTQLPALGDKDCHFIITVHFKSTDLSAFSTLIKSYTDNKENQINTVLFSNIRSLLSFHSKQTFTSENTDHPHQCTVLSRKQTFSLPPLSSSLSFSLASTVLFKSRCKRRPKSLNIVEPPERTIFWNCTNKIKSFMQQWKRNTHFWN